MTTLNIRSNQLTGEILGLTVLNRPLAAISRSLLDSTRLAHNVTVGAMFYGVNMRQVTLKYNANDTKFILMLYYSIHPHVMGVQGIATSMSLHINAGVPNICSVLISSMTDPTHHLIHAIMNVRFDQFPCSQDVVFAVLCVPDGSGIFLLT